MYGSQLCPNKCAWKITLKKYQCQRGRAILVCAMRYVVMCVLPNVIQSKLKLRASLRGSSTIRQVTEVSPLPPAQRSPLFKLRLHFCGRKLIQLFAYFFVSSRLLASASAIIFGQQLSMLLAFFLLAISSINVNTAVDMNRGRNRARNLQIMQSININKIVFEFNSFNCSFSFI